MNAIRKKLAINQLSAIDYYDETGKWIAGIWEPYPNTWSSRTSKIELLACYKTEYEAIKALSFWIDVSPEIIPE